MSARPIDLIAAARQRLAVQRHWRAAALAAKALILSVRSEA